jgi:putative intracellular protease/amidase
VKVEVNCILFDDFETLDLFGPVEVFGKVEGYNIRYFSMNGRVVKSCQNTRILTENIDKISKHDILIIPGGQGTRTLVNDDELIQKLKIIAEKSLWCLSVCTGLALLAKTGLLDEREATSNKISFEWVRTNGKNVKWNDKARWVADEKYYTSSGISVGIDMSLGFVCDRFGEEKAKEIARRMEYRWDNDKNNDIFAKLCGD